MKNIFNNKKFKYGSAATIITVLVVAVVVIINIIASSILNRLPTKVDLTANKLFALSDKSIDFVKDINTDVTITVCMDEEDFENADTYGYYYQANQVIKKYAEYSNHIKVQYVDLMADPTFANNYTSYDLSDGDIIVESDKRLKVIDPNELVETQSDSNYQQKYLAASEKVMTSALMYVTEDKLIKAATLTGHSETDLTSSENVDLASMLSANNYELTTLNITTQDFSEDIDLALLVSPSVDFTEQELQKLDAFLNNDGNYGKTLLYISSTTEAQLPNLNAFLAEWGIEVQNSIVFETNSKNVYSYGNNAYPYIMGLDFADEAYTENLANASLPVIGATLRPINALFEEKDGLKTTALLKTPETAYEYPFEMIDNGENLDAGSVKTNTFTVALLSQKTKFEGTTPLTSNIIAFGGEGLFWPTWTKSAQYNNNPYLVGVINDLCGKSEAIDIVSVEYSNETFTVTESQTKAVFYIFVVIIPLVTLGLGIFVFMRRRHK